MLYKDSIDKYLSELSVLLKGIANLPNKVKVIIVGGAAITLSCEFRESTLDIDAYFQCEDLIRGAITKVGEKFGIGDDWLNSNVTVTTSFSEKVLEFIKPYKVFNKVLDVYTVDVLTLICMKAVACRPDSHDLLDIENILNEHGDITFDDIRKRFMYIFRDWSLMKIDAQLYLTTRFNAMPPDMLDFIKQQLPPSILRGKSEDEIYKICSSTYSRLIR